MTEPNSSAYEQHLETSRQRWNAEAATFDDAPDHGLRDPAVRAAWTRLLKASLPAGSGTALDIGCGSGSLSLVLAELGYEVTGIDFSPDMIARAEAKAAAANQRVRFQVMDAAFPDVAGLFDALICRHLLWALPEPAQVLERWSQLLRPGGRLLLIEGCWFTGAGLRAQQILDALPAALRLIAIENLSDQPALWGHTIEDERYAILTERV